MNTFRVEVMMKPGMTDPAGAALLDQLRRNGLPDAKQAHVGALYEFSGRWSLSQAMSAADGLLADPVTQEFHVFSEERPPVNGVGTHWRVELWFRPEVAHPTQGPIFKAIADLGLPGPETMRLGTLYKILGRISHAQAERAVKRLLANLAIQQYSLTSC